MSGGWRLGRDFVWTTASGEDEAVQGIFHADFFPWDQQGQVVVLGTPGCPLALDERHLNLTSDPSLFGELKSGGALGSLLPGVDGSIMGLYLFNADVVTSVQTEIEKAAQAAGGQCIIATREEFGAQLRESSRPL